MLQLLFKKTEGINMMKKVYILVLLSIGMVSTAYANKRIIVDLSSQKAIAMDNGRVSFSGNISTGRPGRETPTGYYRVLEKDIDHISSSWPKPHGGARMNYMLRVTGYGIAMHLGFVPNYPASHGCIRLENGFAQKMYYWARVGTPITIRGHAPRRVDRTSYYTPTPSIRHHRRLTALETLSSSPKILAMVNSSKKTVRKIRKKIPKVNPLDAISSR